MFPGGTYVWTQVQRGPGKGLWLALDPRTGREYRDGAGESAVQNAIAGFLQPGMIFYDLGANIGYVTLLAARLVGETGKVFSFEPDAPTATRLLRNIEKNGFRNVTVLEAGVWSSSGNLNFVPADASSPDRGLGRLSLGAPSSGSTPVRSVALDDFIRDAPPPNGLKCDVEGAEVEALRGASALLRKHHPWMIVELHSAENRGHVLELLPSLGYDVTMLDEQHVIGRFGGGR